MDLKIPENAFLYVYVTNQSLQKVDFDHLTIIHQQGRVLEENHYYPYGMLIEGLSYVSNYNHPCKYKFNGIAYETSNDLYNLVAPFRSYDPAIAKWNQLDPMNQFENGYFAFGGNPVSMSDPLGLKSNYVTPGHDAYDADAPSVTKRDLFDWRGRGGGGFLDASERYYSNEDLIGLTEIKQFYFDLPKEVRELLNMNCADFVSGIVNGDYSVRVGFIDLPQTPNDPSTLSGPPTAGGDNFTGLPLDSQDPKNTSSKTTSQSDERNRRETQWISEGTFYSSPQDGWTNGFNPDAWGPWGKGLFYRWKNVKIEDFGPPLNGRRIGPPVQGWWNQYFDSLRNQLILPNQNIIRRDTLKNFITPRFLP